MITSVTLHRGTNGDVNEHTYSRHKHNQTHAQQGGTGGLATTRRLSRYDYVVKPAFRYLNRDMRGVDWRSSPVSASMAPGRQKTVQYPGHVSVLRIDMERDATC